MILSKREIKDIQILVRFVHIFCRENHKRNPRKPFSPSGEGVAHLINEGVQLCESCSELLTYGIRKRFRCPHNPKPMCKKCHTQCYNRNYREKVREVMRFSGPYVIKRGRLDLLYHYLA
ncbi:MAG: nitrous oxide-stimulated promoter family protein [Proteobacteria bacterium]|nr:nitrous oxide-stimulated promoter family protein [Pseudomonadota bacterium]